MDAKITKQRLGNLLSYDWLKILIAVAFAIAALVVFFTTVSPRPSRMQSYEVYGYTDVSPGEDADGLADELSYVLSYDILTVSSEHFEYSSWTDWMGTSAYNDAAYGGRRAAGKGEALFLSDVDVYGEDGSLVRVSAFKDFMDVAFDYDGNLTSLLDVRVLLSDCERYLADALGENWREAPVPDEDAVRAVFMARNGKDRRFRTAAKREEGVRQEIGRMQKLRTAVLTVEEALADGRLSFKEYEREGETIAAGFKLGKLRNISKLYYYEEEQDGEMVKRTDELLLLFYNNSGINDLKYDNFLLLSYLVGEYGA